jgi:hypothetical protein
MERIAEALQGIASEVRWYEWEDAPPKGDAADHPALNDEGEDDEEIKLFAELVTAPIYSPNRDKEFSEIKSNLPIKTVAEILEEAGDGPEWIVENILARGAVTDFSGLAKKGGKTTFWCHAIAAGARGEDHAGSDTTPAKNLYLTEQGNNFAEALRDAGLAEHPEHIQVVQFKDVSALGWERTIRQAGEDARRLGFDVLVVDTFAAFARLKASEENDAAVIGERMRVLREVAQRFDIELWP